MKSFLTLLSGLLFGFGLVVSHMTEPAKVIGFLDVAGDWDPSLMFVMVGAIAVHFVLFRLILRLRNPLFASAFQIPKRTDLDPRLIGGAALFGIGWGLGGVCPGPGITLAASGSAYAMVFVIAMSLGVLAERRLLRKKAA
ncbi:MAG: DUF6691 family protein [Polyangiaceae bacterium]